MRIEQINSDGNGLSKIIYIYFKFYLVLTGVELIANRLLIVGSLMFGPVQRFPSHYKYIKGRSCTYYALIFGYSRFFAR